MEVASRNDDDPSESESEWPPRNSPSPFQDHQQRQERGGDFIKTVMRRIRLGGVSGSELGEYRVYPWRWFMLATLCLLNLSNGMVRRGERIIITHPLSCLIDPLPTTVATSPPQRTGDSLAKNLVLGPVSLRRPRDMQECV